MEVKQRHWSNSSTTIWKRCTYRFYELYGKPKPTIPDTKNVGQQLGSAGHMALKAFYSGKSTAEAMDWAWQEFGARDDKDLPDWERLVAALTLYWKVAAVDRWTVKHVERSVYAGRIMGIMDLIMTDPNGATYIVDHKFQKSSDLRHLYVDTQVSFYLLLARLTGLKVDGFMLNVIPMSKDVRYPIRKIVTRSSAFLDNFERELQWQVHKMDQFLEAPTPIRTFTDECKWGCPVYKVCISRMEIPPYTMPVKSNQEQETYDDKTRKSK